MNKLVSYQTILAAQNGDSKAMESIIAHYDPLISKYSTRFTYDEYGNALEVIDEEIRQHIETALMMQIIYKFDCESLPEGEMLDEDDSSGK